MPHSVKTDAEAAFESQLDCAGEVALGFPSPTVAGVEMDGVLSEITAEEVLLSGGTGDRGGIRLAVRNSDLPGDPARNAVITARGATWRYLGPVRRTHACVLLTCGDPATQ